MMMHDLYLTIIQPHDQSPPPVSFLKNFCGGVLSGEQTGRTL